MSEWSIANNFRLRKVLFAVSFLLFGLVFSFDARAVEPHNGVSGDCAWEIDSNGGTVIKPASGDGGICYNIKHNQ